MNIYNIEFSKDEITGLLQLVDIAVQAKGLLIAEHAVYFQNKIRQSVQKTDENTSNISLKD